MGKIVILDENTSNQIAAGEVVERPASVVKELVENSIDAGSSSITVEINNGGISFIKVVDNGKGIDEDDVEIAFERHSTSKIRRADDLESISTLGFRGEALASIASVSSVELTTRVKDKQYGKYINIQGGVVKEVRQTGCPVGTTFVVRDLFYNTPARFKFLKKDATEAGYISDIVNRVALGNQHISMKLINNRNTVIHTPGNNDLLSTIFSLYGKEIAREVIEVSFKDEKIEICGYAGKPEIARANRNYQSIYINGRYIKNKTISSAIDEAYKTYLLKNKFAFVVLHIRINPMFVDVNVHPTKMEVRFSDEQSIFKAVYHAINNALLSKSLIRSVEMSQNPKNLFKFEENKVLAKEFVQENLNNRTIDTNIPSEMSDNKKEVKFGKDIAEKVYEEKKTDNTIESASVINYKTVDVVREDTKIQETKPSLRDILPADLSEKQINSEFIEAEKEVDKELNRKILCEESNKKVPEEDKEESNDAFIESTSNNSGNNANSDYRKQEANNLLDARIIGQVFSTYILMQEGENLILIDQHAAHERIMFEELKKKYKENENLAQYLLSSIVIELTNQEVKIIEENKEKLIRLGFIFENFGNNSIILRSIPVSLTDNASVKETFLDILDFLMSDIRKENILIEEEALYRVACKSAVKANKKLDELEIKKIIKDLNNIENPYTCPHGRPTLIKITKYEFEKMFKRIV